ncbi:MAG: glycosyltransferase family 4 protein [Verrucomicrobiaceae bacterium]|nr:glycosyltransferase family 4 protein [Verrucomicrobiaceae bacterium]
MKLFFTINQDLFDGSAHSLYCYRHAAALAASAPEGSSVELVYPGASPWRAKDETAHAAAHFQLASPPPQVTALPSVRKKKHGKGLTLNAWFHYHAAKHLGASSSAGDFFITASFPKLLKYMESRPGLRGSLQFLYEVHQLARLDGDKDSAKALAEKRALAGADRFVTTTHALQSLLEEDFPRVPCLNLGLACVPTKWVIPEPPALDRDLRLGYLGSVYPGQGIDWLLENWRGIREGLGVPATLLIAGGSGKEVTWLRRKAEDGDADSVEFLGQLSQSDVPSFLARVNALVIPAMQQGRMPFVAITKAYDYLTYGRPVIASELPSITEVMRPGQEALGFTPGTAGSLLNGLRQLISRPDLAPPMVKAATARAADFDPQIRARKYWRWLFDSTM